MKAIERSIVGCAAVLLLLMFLFPPFMSIDPESNGRVHAALGRHPVWNPPSAEFVFRTLYPNTAELRRPGRLTGFVPRINKVQLTVDVLAVVLTCSLVTWALRRGRRRARWQQGPGS